MLSSTQPYSEDRKQFDSFFFLTIYLRDRNRKVASTGSLPGSPQWLLPKSGTRNMVPDSHENMPGAQSCEPSPLSARVCMNLKLQARARNPTKALRGHTQAS